MLYRTRCSFANPEDDNPVRTAYTERAGAHPHQRILEELSVHNGVLFKGMRVIIPRVMQPEVMSKIHASHLGVEGCLRKARDTVFWPNVNGEVRDHISQCYQPFAVNFRPRIQKSLCKVTKLQSVPGVELPLTSSSFMERSTVFIHL